MKLDSAKIIQRMREATANDTQREIAEVLGVDQTTVSKMFNNAKNVQIDYVSTISEMYDVPIEWLLGLTESKDGRDFVDLNNLNYEQISLILDKLLELGVISIPDLSSLQNDAVNQFIENYIRSSSNERDNKEKLEKSYEFDLKEEVYFSSNLNSDYLLINDRLLSHIFEARKRSVEFDYDTYELWKNNRLKTFKNSIIKKFSKIRQEAMDYSDCYSPNFTDKDWVKLYKELYNMSDEEVEQYIQKKKEERK